ncbi:MAG TPA: hypothetical protein HA257_07015 [Candidatus Methanoperedenaceae archaeon]|nr:hypothetical protein [Candidatus Methanoperedenaceae archaeon]
MQICCSQCNSSVPANNIDLNSKIAKCANCNSVFNFKDQLAGIFEKRADITLPDGVSIRKDILGMMITRRWFRRSILFLTLFTLFWDGVVLSIYWSSIVSGQYNTAMSGSLHAIIGIFLTYYVLTGYFNKTYISVNPQSISIRNGPIPALGNKSIGARDVRQLYSKENIQSSRRGISYTYDLYAINSQGKHAKLLSGLENAEQVLYIEQQMESFLHIKDEPVSREIPR